MADQKLSALTQLPSGSGDPFADLLYYVLGSGPTSYKATLNDVMINLRRKMTWDFFEMQKPDEGSLAQGTQNSGSIGASNQVAGNHPGVQGLETGSASATGAAAIYASNAFGWVVGGGQLRFVSWMRTDGNLSSGTQRYGLLFGLSDDYFNFAPNNCIVVRYRDDTNTGKWQLCCRNGGSESTADVGLTVAVSTWYRIEININAAANSITASVTPEGGATSTSAAVTTNISTTEMHVIALILKAIGTTDRSLLLDAVGWMQAFTTSR